MTQDTPPGLEAVPVSCYSGSFRTWAFDNDLIPELDMSEADDHEYKHEDDENFEDNVDHYFIDQSSDDSKIGDTENRIFVDCAIQTDVALSLTAANIKWTPCIDHHEHQVSATPVTVA